MKLSWWAANSICRVAEFPEMTHMNYAKNYAERENSFRSSMPFLIFFFLSRRSARGSNKKYKTISFIVRFAVLIEWNRMFVVEWHVCAADYCTQTTCTFYLITFGYIQIDVMLLVFTHGGFDASSNTPTQCDDLMTSKSIFGSPLFSFLSAFIFFSSFFCSTATKTETNFNNYSHRNWKHCIYIYLCLLFAFAWWCHARAPEFHLTNDESNLLAMSLYFYNCKLYNMPLMESNNNNDNINIYQPKEALSFGRKVFFFSASFGRSFAGTGNE